MSFVYGDQVRAVVVAGLATREPTADEAIDIHTYCRKLETEEDRIPLGVEDVPGVGEVWFKMLRPASLAVDGEPT